MIKGDIYLDNFTRDNVDLRIKNNLTWRRNYKNSLIDRVKVQEEVDEPYQSVIFMMWGDEPTVSEGEDR